MKYRETTMERGDLEVREETGGNAYITELAGKAAQGDSDALFALCQATAKGILYRLARLLPDRMDAEDTAQEVLIRVCENIRGLKAPEAFVTWLNKIITGEISRLVTKRNRQGVAVVSLNEHPVEIAEENEEFLPHEYAVRREDRSDVMEVVDMLPKRQLEAVMLHYYEGMSVNEVAETMGITAPGVSRYLMLAREKIRKGLEAKSGAYSYAGCLAFLPIGQLLAQVLGEESGRLALTDSVWLEQAMCRCAELVGHASAAAAGAGSVASGVTTSAASAAAGAKSAAAIVTPLGIAGSLVAVAAVTFTLVVTMRQDQPDELPPQLPFVEAVGTVAFTGGEGGYDHLNPKGAEVSTSSEYGELEVLGWAVMPTGGGAVIMSSEGSDASEAFAMLLEGGHDGEHVIVFSLRDAHGDTHELSRSFYIQLGMMND